MAPLKETLEAGNHTGSDEKISGQPAPDAGHLRADAVSLEIPVKVHGSRVTEVLRGNAPLTQLFEEQAVTMIVFPQGGVLRMATPVSPGQMAVLTNLKSGQEAICRVVKIRSYATGKSYVEIEFTNRQPGYWGVYFPSDSSEQAKKAVFPAHGSSVGTPKVDFPVEPSVADLHRPLASHSAEPSTSRRIEPAGPLAPAARSANTPLSARASEPSHFAPIGSQEDVQPAASATGGAYVIPFHGPERRPRVVEPYNRAATAESPIKQPAIPALAPSQESEPGPQVKASQLTLGLQDELGRAETVHRAPPPGRNWLLVAAAAALVFAAIGTWTLYFHTNSGTSGVARASSPVVAVSQPMQASNSTALPAQQPAPAPPAPAKSSDAAQAPQATSTATPLIHETDSILVSGAKGAESSSPKQQVPNVVSDMFGALNAHPVSSKPASAKEPGNAPALDAASPAGPAGTLEGISAPSFPAPTPAAVTPAVAASSSAVSSAAPVRVGGQIKPPRLVHTIVPEFPDIARSANVQGTVVLDTIIDASGKVVNVKVVSGPMLLRQAAIDALKQWKYEPSKLDGQPISVQMTVSIQFKR